METIYQETITREEIETFPVFAFDGEIRVIENAGEVDEAVAYLSAHSCLGFDTETRPAFHKGETYPVSLLQLAAAERVYLFRLNKFGFTPSLRRLLADVRIKKEDQKYLLQENHSVSTYGTRNEKGSGLGLILSQEFIKLNNGKLYFTSAEGQGTTFYFALPKAKPQSPMTQ